MWSGLYFRPSSPSRWTGRPARADAAILFERGQRECGSSLQSIAADGAGYQRFRLGPERRLRVLHGYSYRDHSSCGQGGAVPGDDASNGGWEVRNAEEGSGIDARRIPMRHLSSRRSPARPRWGPFCCGLRQLASPVRLAQIGLEARRHRRDVARIGRIPIAIRARRAGAAATAGPFAQERPIEVIFTNPPSVVTPRTVLHRIPPGSKGHQCRRSHGFRRGHCC